MTSPDRVQLGDDYTDSVTGFLGTATARTEYIGGSVSVRLERADATGKPEEVWLPECRLDPHDKPRRRVGITPGGCGP